MDNPQRALVIFDCDNTMGKPFKEVDDGLTFLYLLGRSDLDLLGITTTFGNGPLDQVHPLTEQLLRWTKREDVRLVKGEGARHEPPTDAARFLAEAAASRPGQISLLATGPLGNLRAAAELDPAFYRNLKQVVCMGGYLRPLRLGWRNVAELNFSCDPEGAFSVLHAPCPVTVMNAHICLQAAFGWGDLRRLRHWGGGTRSLVRKWLLGHALYAGIPRFYLWDLLPAVYLSHPELFDANPVRVSSTVADLETGTLVLSDAGEGPAINMPSRIKDIGRFRQLLFSAWERVQIDEPR